MKKLKVGLIGFGVSGRYFHAPLLLAHPGFEIVKVSSSRASEVREVIPGVSVTADPHEVINDKNLDLIVNCAPTGFHYSYSAAALESGKHVVVEKPFVTDVDEGEKLIALAAEKGLALSVFHNRRWDGDFLTVQKLLKSGALGEIKQFESHFDRWRPVVRAERWRERSEPGAGIFYDLGAHLIDQALTLFGMPDDAIADVAIQKKNGLSDDYFHLILKYGQMRVILHGSSFSQETPRFQILGDKGSFTKYGLDPQEDQLKSGMSPLDSSFGVEDKSCGGDLFLPEENRSEKLESEQGNYLEFYDRLHKFITTGGSEVPVASQDALAVIRVVTETARF